MAINLGQQLVGPPSSLANQPPSVGAAIAPPARQPGAPVQVPPGTNPLQAILFRARNDPNFARALRVASLNLLNSGRDESTIRSFARAGQAGLSTLEQGRSQEQAAAQAAQEQNFKEEMLRRQTEAQEKARATTAEGERRRFISQEAQRKAAGAAADRAHEIDLKRLAIDEARASQERKAAGRATEADTRRDMIRGIVRQKAQERDVVLSKADEDLEILLTERDMQAKGTTVPVQGLVNPFLTTELDNVPYEKDPAKAQRQTAEATNRAIAGASQARDQLSTPAPDAVAGLEARLETKRPPKGPGPGGSSRGGFPRLAPDDRGTKTTILKEENGKYLIKGIRANGEPTVERWVNISDVEPLIVK